MAAHLRIRAFWLTFSFSCVVRAADSFVVSVPPTVAVIEIGYFLTGPFGGFGSHLSAPDSDGSYRIPLEQDGKRASGLKAILYGKGCRIDTLAVSVSADSTGSARFGCVLLTTVMLRGRVSPLPGNAAAYDVVVRYRALWGHRFYGIVDGIVQTFEVGRAPLDPEGRFSIQIPDFSRDPVTSRMGDAYLDFSLVVRSSLNNAGSLSPPRGFSDGNTGLKVLPDYRDELDFTWRP